MAQSQVVSNDVERLIVAVENCDGEPQESGSGFIIGEKRGPSSTTVFVLTAEHVLGSSAKTVKPIVKMRGLDPIECSLGPSSEANKDGTRDAKHLDLALLRCEVARHVDFSFNVLGKASSFAVRTSLMLAINGVAADIACLNQSKMAAPQIASSYFALLGKPDRELEFYNSFSGSIKGASGGPLMSDRSEILGIVLDENTGGQGKYGGTSWAVIDDWINWENLHLTRKIGPLSHTAALLRRNNVDVSVGVTNVYVPSFGYLTAAPVFRVATSLARFPALSLAFDYTSSQRTVNSETVSLSVPAATAQLQLGSLWGPLLRRDWLGGFSVGAGAASVNLQQKNATEETVRSIAGVFDAGWRYRLPGRSWGFTATYREGIIFGKAAQHVYPRFRSFGSGIFIAFK